jgi:4-hydroxybenzoate polyprenyltransferase
VADEQRIADARRIVADFRRFGYGMGASAGVWGAAVFGTLAIPIGLLLCIPATAHAFGEPHAEPIALLGSLFFGTIGYSAIKRIRAYRAAKRYLAEHAAG